MNCTWVPQPMAVPSQQTHGDRLGCWATSASDMFWKSSSLPHIFCCEFKNAFTQTVYLLPTSSHTELTNSSVKLTVIYQQKKSSSYLLLVITNKARKTLSCSLRWSMFYHGSCHVLKWYSLMCWQMSRKILPHFLANDFKVDGSIGASVVFMVGWALIILLNGWSSVWCGRETHT